MTCVPNDLLLPLHVMVVGYQGIENHAWIGFTAATIIIVIRCCSLTGDLNNLCSHSPARDSQ